MRPSVPRVYMALYSYNYCKVYSSCMQISLLYSSFQVFPVYHSALEALSSVKKNDVLEVMSYREPPSILTPIFNALCMLFDRPQT